MLEQTMYVTYTASTLYESHSFGPFPINFKCYATIPAVTCPMRGPEIIGDVDPYPTPYNGEVINAPIDPFSLSSEPDADPDEITLSTGIFLPEQEIFTPTFDSSQEVKLGIPFTPAYYELLVEGIVATDCTHAHCPVATFVQRATDETVIAGRTWGAQKSTVTF